MKKKPARARAARRGAAPGPTLNPGDESVTFPLLDLVRRLAAIAATQGEIVDFTGIPLRTLERRLAEKKSAIAQAYAAGIEERRASLLRMMWTSARAGNVVMQIWLSKNLMGWKDRAEIDFRSLAKKLGELSDEDLVRLSRGETIDQEPEAGGGGPEEAGGGGTLQ